MKGLAALSLIVSAALASAQITIQSAYPSDSSANPLNVNLGESFYMTARLHVDGPASYRVRFDLPYASRTSAEFAYTGDATITWGPYTAMLAQPIPVRVSIDGDDTVAPLTVAVTPTLPSQSIEYFAPQHLSGWLSATATLAGGTATGLQWYSPAPTTSGFQQVISANSPGSRLNSTPYAQPVFAVGRQMGVSTEFETLASSSRVNPDLLRSVTWTTYRNLPSTVSAWLRPETYVESQSTDVAQFVRKTLPQSYKSTTRPYDVAQRLFQAVVARMQYVEDDSRPDAVRALRTGRGDCGYFTAAFVASCRNAGIPAREVCGFTLGSNAWHVWSEFYLPGAGWIPADPAYCDGLCPDGSLPLYFGIIPDLDERIAGTYGFDHVVSGRKFPMLQSPAVYFAGSTKVAAVQAFCGLSVATGG